MPAFAEQGDSRRGDPNRAAQKYASKRAQSQKTPLPPAPLGRVEAAEPPKPTTRNLGHGRGGKRRDAKGRQPTVLFEKEVHWTALDLLRRHDEGRDMSDLLNSLLKEWNKCHQPPKL
jgi:hypothetical protein